MDHFAQKDMGLEIDIENGGFIHEDSRESPVTSVKEQAKVLLAKIYGTFVDEPENRASFLANPLDCSIPSVENVAATVSTKLETNKGNGVEEKKVVKQKPKPSSAKKPPRPPRAPSLDAADQKLIKELAELARLKRARTERMKALRKMKASNASSSNSNVLAFMFTIVVALLIIFQGMPSRGRAANFHGSPMPVGAVDSRNMISLEFLGNPPVAARDLNGPISSSPNSLEQVAGLDLRDKLRYSG